MIEEHHSNRFNQDPHSKSCGPLEGGRGPPDDNEIEKSFVRVIRFMEGPRSRRLQYD